MVKLIFSKFMVKHLKQRSFNVQEKKNDFQIVSKSLLLLSLPQVQITVVGPELLIYANAKSQNTAKF